MATIKREALTETNLIDSPFFKVFAKNYLDYLGNSNPTHKQLAEIQALLSNTWIRLPICFDLRLSEQEKQCLYLSAQGKGLKEIASFLNVSMRRVTQYRQAIFKKLGCRNITSAIIVGIRYGVIKKENVLED
ncbi:response regulator transcription factor [Legionella feeleii]|uniref:Transcriptional regulator LuxR n=4 Tax=Legionella TaxID=445 RepID=A0A0W0TM17_9GAMM|nr:helix-turn-helix transcriptional regulator [Legionella feeleii]KTC96639.1 transcriptional regulator LuxR [Legionella feeleii]SPX60701.1 transcriptional regulator LuxR [Legionella feeleii]